MIYNNQT